MKRRRTLTRKMKASNADTLFLGIPECRWNHLPRSESRSPPVGLIVNDSKFDELVSVVKLWAVLKKSTLSP